MAKHNGNHRSSQSRASSSGRSGSRGGGSGGRGGSGGSQPRKATSSPSSSSSSRASGRARGQHGGGRSVSREQAQQLSFGQFARRGAVAGAGAKAVGTVRENPIPAALIGAGLMWLIVKNRQRLPLPDMPEALSSIADTARESFSGASQSTRQAVRGGVGSAADSVKDGAAAAAEYAQRGAAKVGQAAKKGFEKTRDAAATTWDEHPLTVGIALLAAGVAAGMMLPAPKGAAIRRAAKKLTRRVTSTGEDLLENARELLHSSARSVSREAKRQELTPAAISRKAKRVAAAVTS